MMVKDWLKEYQKMKRKLEYWHDVANEYSTYSSPVLKEDSVMSSHGNSAEATVELVINRRENALAHISQLSKSMDKRIQAISELDDVYERQILFYRYNKNLPYTIISSECTLSDLINIDEAISGRIAEKCKSESGNYCLSIKPDAKKNYRLNHIKEL